MIRALVLSGGVGARLGAKVPKQYIRVNGKPIIGFCLDVFQNNNSVESITIVVSEEWKEDVENYISENKIYKYSGAAPSGSSRQQSIINGLKKMKADGASDDDVVIIHDAARPNVDDELINGCISSLEKADCSMPIIPLKDTVYYIEEQKIESLLDRSKLFAGQAPEGVRFGPYYKINLSLSENEAKKVTGTSALAYSYGLSVKVFPGKESNYKITTAEDLFKFKEQTEESK